MGAGLDSRIKFRHIRVVQAVEQLGSVASAAEALCVSAPAISKAVGEAEDIIGAELFRREGRHLVPTQAGQVFLRFGRAITEELRLLDAELSLLAEGTTGSLVIGTGSHQAKNMISEAIGKLKSRQPRVFVRIVDMEPSEVVGHLRDGRIDVGFTSADVIERFDDIDGFQMFEIDTVMIASAGHPVLSAPDLDWNTVNAYAWALPSPGHPMWECFEQLWREKNIRQPLNVVEIGSLLSAPQFFSRMQMIGPAPRVMAEDWARAGYVKIVPLELGFNLPPHSLIWSTSYPLTKPAEAFIRIARGLVAASEGQAA
jgi:DNA-binding transcriptional LysR family regulator